MTPMVLDLFSGACGGWSLGLHSAGFETVAACEIDPWRRQIFAHNFPKARMYDDVRSISAGRLVSDLGALPDIIVGSPPCQDASAANTKGKGVDGERTGLFFEAIRIVGECRPRWVAFENVPGLRNRGADRVLGALEGLGYACWPLVVAASDVGANHERKRVWFIAFDTAQVGHDCGRAWRRGPHGNSASYSQGRFVGVVPNSDEARSSDGQMVSGLRSAQVADDGCAAGWGNARHAGDASQVGWREGRQRRRAQPVAGLSVKARGNVADANEGRQSHGAVDAEMGGGESAGGAASEPWACWNGGLAGHLRLDDGLSARLAQQRGLAGAVVAAYGDAVVPQITEAIGNAIWRVEAALEAVMECQP